MVEANRGTVRAVVLTGLAVTAFAANSLLCRLALLEGGMDPVGFTVVRMVSAAMVLTILLRVGTGNFGALRAGAWTSALWLFVYAIAFSCAYVELETGTGALLLFGSVQTTMISIGLWRGERPPVREWVGLGLAFGGVGYLVSPGATAPEPIAAASMVVAGVAWGLYSLRGRGVADPAASTCGNFVRALPLVAVVGLVFATQFEASPVAWSSAIASGALASGLGYVLWYAALRYLTATRAALVQLLAPVIATLSGVVVLDERLTPRIVLVTVVVFAGVVLATTSRRR